MKFCCWRCAVESLQKLVPRVFWLSCTYLFLLFLPVALVLSRRANSPTTTCTDMVCIKCFCAANSTRSSHLAGANTQRHGSIWVSAMQKREFSNLPSPLLCSHSASRNSLLLLFVWNHRSDPRAPAQAEADSNASDVIFNKNCLHRTFCLLGHQNYLRRPPWYSFLSAAIERVNNPY